jgi:GxxExxY protein
MEVHKELGKGFLESVYQEAFEIEMSSLQIPFSKEVPLNIKYKNRNLAKYFVADFVCYGKIIIELKSINDLSLEHTSQVFNYLRATDMKLGIIFNFGAKSLQ